MKQAIPDEDKPAKKGTEETIRYSWDESGARWGVTDSGQLRILSCGDLVPGVVVRVRLPGLWHKRGRLRALLPGWGPAPRPIMAAVAFKIGFLGKAPVPEPPPITRLFRVDELEVTS